MQITFDPYNPVEYAFVSSVLATLASENGDGLGSPSVDPVTAAASGEEYRSSSPDSVATVAAVDTDAEPVKRKRRTKAEMEAARAAETAPAPEPAAETPAGEEIEAAPDAAPAPTVAKTFTQDDVRNALQNYTKAKGLTAGIDLLNSYDVRRISELNPEFYAEVIAKCEA